MMLLAAADSPNPRANDTFRYFPLLSAIFRYFPLLSATCHVCDNGCDDIAVKWMAEGKKKCSRFYTISKG
jgi:hypothetical protein